MKYLIPILFLGVFLRFQDLGVRAFWIDEVSFVQMQSMTLRQEYAPLLVGMALPQTEFWQRFPFALLGALTPLALYLVIPDKRVALCLALLIAVSPLHVFWSRMARPYSFAGFFMVLGWRFWWVQVLAMLSTPIALIGTNVLKREWKWVAVIIGIAVITYFVRTDYDRGHFTIQNILVSSRWFYLPTLALALWGAEFLSRYGITHAPESKRVG